jgi:hypothetical protein
MGRKRNFPGPSHRQLALIKWDRLILKYICVCMYVCMHACMYVCMCLYMCMYVCIYIYIEYVCMYVCIYVAYVCTYLEAIFAGVPTARHTALRLPDLGHRAFHQRQAIQVLSLDNISIAFSDLLCIIHSFIRASETWPCQLSPCVVVGEAHTKVLPSVGRHSNRIHIHTYIHTYIHTHHIHTYINKCIHTYIHTPAGTY